MITVQIHFSINLNNNYWKINKREKLQRKSYHKVFQFNPNSRSIFYKILLLPLDIFVVL